jgi:hypothetical protein
MVAPAFTANVEAAETEKARSCVKRRYSHTACWMTTGGKAVAGGMRSQPSRQPTCDLALEPARYPDKAVSTHRQYTGSDIDDDRRGLGARGKRKRQAPGATPDIKHAIAGLSRDGLIAGAKGIRTVGPSRENVA